MLKRNSPQFKTKIETLTQIISTLKKRSQEANKKGNNYENFYPDHQHNNLRTVSAGGDNIYANDYLGQTRIGSRKAVRRKRAWCNRTVEWIPARMPVASVAGRCNVE
jgi:hypothetical protein